MNKIKKDPVLYGVYKQKVLTCKNGKDVDLLLDWLINQAGVETSQVSCKDKSKSSRPKSIPKIEEV